MKSLFKIAIENEDVTPVAPVDAADKAAQAADVDQISAVTEMIEAEKGAIDGAAEFDTNLSDSARTLDTAAALEELAEAVAQIDEITPIERALIQTTMNMAAAGTDVDATKIAPGMESFVTGALAAESIKDKVKNLIARTKEAFLRIGKALVAAVEGLAKVVAIKEKRLDAAITILETHKSKGIEPTKTKTSLRNGAYYQKAGGGVASSDEYLRLVQGALSALTRVGQSVKTTVLIEKAMSGYGAVLAGGDFSKFKESSMKDGKDFISQVTQGMKTTKSVKDDMDVVTASPGVGVATITLQFPKSPDALERFVKFAEFNAGAKFGAVEMDVVKADKLIAELRKVQTGVVSARKEMEATVKNYNQVLLAVSAVENYGKSAKGYNSNTAGVFTVISNMIHLYIDTKYRYTKLTETVISGAVAFAEAQQAAYK